MIEPYFILAGFTKAWATIKAFLLGVLGLILLDHFVNSSSRKRKRQ